jgi:hypothetical protein
LLPALFYQKTEQTLWAAVNFSNSPCNNNNNNNNNKIKKKKKKKKRKIREKVKKSRRSRRRGKCSDRLYIYYTENRTLIAMTVRKQCPLVLQVKVY